MVKRQRRSSSKAKNKVIMFESEDASTDRISMLQDECLVLILSFLTLKESVATSILSQRWRYVWTLVPRLDFDGTKTLFKKRNDQEFVTHAERSTYSRLVDRVLNLHKSCVIEEFRVHFNLTKSYEKYVDKWVRYALDRKVKSLELNLSYIHDVFLPRSSNDCCTFPYQIMRQYVYMKNTFKQFNPIHFKYLEKISLAHVNVNGEALEFFLSNCLLLKYLSISESIELVSLRVIGPFPSLKRLEIISCLNLNFFEVRDSNIVYLKYIGESIQNFILKNIPQLVEIFIGGTMKMASVLSMFSSVLPQLEKFKILIGCWLSMEETEMLYSNVRMSKLKDLVVTPFFAGSLLPLTKIMRASPSLETFVLETPHRGKRFRKSEVLSVEGSYTHLKVVIFRGYCGSICDLEFVKHFLECADALEKIVIDPCKPDDNPCECFWKNNYDDLKEMNISRKRYARARAKKQLVQILPPRINLQIL